MSDGKSIEQVEFQFPVTVSAAAHQLDQLDSEIKRLTSIKDKVRKFLAKSIPVEPNEENPNQMIGELENVQRLSYSQHRVSHAKVLDQVVEELVPKTKLDRVEEIKNEFTKETWIDKFKILEDDGSDYGNF